MDFDPKAYLASKAAPQETQQPEFDPKAYLASKTQPEGVEPSLGDKAKDMALSGLQWAGEKYQKYVDPYTGAPARTAIYAAQQGKDPFMSYQQSFGKDGMMAPTGKMIAQKAGVPDTSLSAVIPSMYSEKGEGNTLKKGGLLDPTASGAAGLGIDMAADPLNVIPFGEIVEAGGKLAKAARLDKAATKVVSKGSGLLSGVNSEAVDRLIQRPTEVLASGEKGRAFDIAEKGREELMGRNAVEQGKISNARKEFAQKFGDKEVNTQPIIDQNQGFLNQKAPVNGEEGAVSVKEASELKNLENKRLKQPGVGSEMESIVESKKSAGSLQRFADYLDSKIKTFENSRLPGGSDTAHQGQLRSMRAKVKEALHGMDPEGLKAADKQFHEYAKEVDSLGKLEDPSTMESFVNNLYGPNKTRTRSIADKYVPETAEALKDLGASKAFDKVGPAGSPHGFRNIVSGGLLGTGAYTHSPGMMASSILLQPAVHKQVIGRASQLIDLLKSNPEVLSKVTDPKVRSILEGFVNDANEQK